MRQRSDEAWSFCSDCRAWFHCPGWFDQAAPEPACPRCGREVSNLEVHRTDAPVPRIEGRCPRCHVWFDADDWFDDDQPVPCCSGCGLVPDRLVYVDAAGHGTERVLTVGSKQRIK